MTCPPCAYVRWIQVVAAFNIGGRPSVIRLLRKRDLFGSHVCREGVPRTAARSPLFRAVAKNGNLGVKPLSGAAIHQTIRRRAEHADYDPTALAKLGGHSLRAGFVTQGTRNGADGPAIARQTGHASLDSVEVYRREYAPLVATLSVRSGCDLRTGRNCARYHCATLVLSETPCRLKPPTPFPVNACTHRNIVHLSKPA
ncbi:tyrosine-type recombinase/integrase [Rhodococcus sp. 1168]|uniref:tyrosine-type recombinase/integrase n=1 Tax=Rhodococcus sp. 1168 TaxID=2018041 RepID=UPI0034CF921A